MKRALPFSLSLILLLVHAGSAISAERVESVIETQVVRIFCTRNAGYYHKPWKSPDFQTVRASGFFFQDEKNFPGKRGLILTNAHAVTMAQSIRISNGREKHRYDVKLLGVCNTADFAVLEMEPEQLDAYERRNGKIQPMELGDSDILRVGDKVLGWGYPLGGERISKSEQGEISRIEVSQYVYSGDSWLVVQASLQQNRGNSGGPVLKDGKVVGIAFQGVKASDRINYFIPINLVRHLIQVLTKQDMIPQWRYLAQHMFPKLKEFYNLGPDQGGVLLDYIIPGGGPDRFGLKPRDIVMEIDGHPIDNFGEIFFTPLDQKILFAEVLNRKLVGYPLTMKVIREGKPIELTGTVPPSLPKLVPKVFTPANYFIFGGVGFVELTLNCLDNLGKSGDKFRAKYAEEFPRRPYQKVVIISEVFPEYGLVDTSAYLTRVESAEGEEVLNIAHLYDTIEALIKKGRKKALLKLTSDIELPLDLEQAAALGDQIKTKYGILYMKTPGGFRE